MNRRSDPPSSSVNRREPGPPGLLGGLLTPWVFGGAFAIGLLLLLATLALLFVLRPSAAPAGPSTAVLITIPAPTDTPVPPTATPTPAPTASVSVPPPPEGGDITVGSYVQVVNTGGDGLRLRVDPGLNGEVRILAGESEVFIVKEGPKEIDGFNWWYLEGPYDANRRGWGVANYLKAVPNP